MSSVNTNEVILTEETSQQNEVLLVDVPVTDENVALNLMVSFFVNGAEKRCIWF